MRSLFTFLFAIVLNAASFSQSTLPLLRVQIYADSVTTAASADAFAVVFGNSYSNSVVLGEDATKLSNPNLNLGVYREEKLLAIEKRKLPILQDSIPFKLTGFSKVNWAFKIEYTNASFPNLAPVLVDRYTHTEHFLSTSGQTIVPFSVSSTIPASIDPYRFTIQYRPLTSLLPVVFSNITAALVNSQVKVEWSTEAETNIDKYLVQKSFGGGAFSTVAVVRARNNNSTYEVWDKQANGNSDYRIAALGRDGKIEYSKVVRLSLESKNSASIYPNPCLGSDITILFENYPPGSYTAYMYSNEGRVVGVNTVVINNASHKHAMKITSTIAKGLYTIVLRGNGSQESVRVIVQ